MPLRMGNGRYFPGEAFFLSAVGVFREMPGGNSRCCGAHQALLAVKMTYDSIDPLIHDWAQRHYLKLFTASGDQEARFAYFSSKSGECYQIWIRPPTRGKVLVGAACVEGRTARSRPHTQRVPIADLPVELENVLNLVVRWMAPSERYFPHNRSPHYS